MKTMCVILLVLLALGPAGAPAQAAHDGDWWRGLSPGTKQCVMTGFLDGMALGQNLSLMGAGNSSDPGCRTTIAQSYTYVRGRYFQNVGASELVSALDDLYADSENYSIIIGRAVWIAVNKIAGTPGEDLQKLILQSRGLGY
ncbi:MAG TPA: hypothetical protein VMF59_04810 [Bacteroidota bacterium]|nr:hypothetical protein [Bacteroidota bacterium]